MIAVVLAAGIDWLEGLLPLLFVGFWILSQIAAVIRRVRGAGDVPAERRPPQRVPEPRPEQPLLERTELERQVEEFLRSRMTGGRQPVAAPAERSPQERKRDRRATKPLPRKQPVPRDGASPPDDVAQHVQEAFAHELSHLQTTLARKSTEPATKPVASAAAELTTMLRSPETIRQVMLLREVLERPTQRW